MRALIAVALVVLAGCPTPRAHQSSELMDPATYDTGDATGQLLRELEVEVQSSYQRISLDAAAAAQVIDPSVGLTAIGVGPDAMSIGTAPEWRWPVVDVGGKPIDVISRGLELRLSADRTVAWSYDDVSLRLPVCGRAAPIPLRVMQVWVRDSERWTLVAEHVAYAQAMGRWLDAAAGPDGARMIARVESQPEAGPAQEALAQALAPDGDRKAWDDRPDAFAIWPDPLQIMRGGATRTGPSLAQSLGADQLAVEGVRLVLGPSRAVAIVSATLQARVQRGGDDSVTIRLRGTFVIERVGEVWRVRAALVSTPITTGALIGRSVGVVATVGTGGHVTTTCL